MRITAAGTNVRGMPRCRTTLDSAPLNGRDVLPNRTRFPTVPLTVSSRGRRAGLPLLVQALASACTGTTREFRSSRPAVAEAPAAPLTLMSFNLRYDNPADGPNAWPQRRDRVAGAIRFHGAHVVGVQEALASMLGDLDALLPTYRRVGVGRSDGVARGEFSAILYDTTRVTALESGTFWLYATPEVVGSRGWDAALERIATWARFRDVRSGCTWVHVNTHFDHVGDSARVESAT
jgi:hypothetical protein